MKILIIEDEKAVSNDLHSTILRIWSESTLPIIHQVYSVHEAVDYLTKKVNPNLIFSDIQLGDGTCFDIFRQFQLSVPIIFCTAYHDYAIRAFNENSIAYVLKPFNSVSIKNSLEKYQNIKRIFSQQEPFENYEHLLNLFSKPFEEKRFSSVLVYYKDNIMPIKMEDIAIIYLEKEETRLITFDGQTYFPGKSLDELEKMVGNFFFRANRQFLVSRPAIKSAYQFFSRKLALNLVINFETKIVVSKEKKTAFLNWLASI